MTLKENRRHGDPLYPVSVYEQICRAGEPLLDLHWHDELEFLYVTRGRAVFRVGTEDYELGEGEAFFANSGVLHSGFSVGGEGCSFRAIVFHPDLLAGGFELMREKYIQPLLAGRYAVPAVLRGADEGELELLGALRSVYRLNETAEPAYELATKGLLHVAVAGLLRMGGPVDVRGGSGSGLAAEHYRMERLKKVIEHIHEGYAGQIRLKELADLLSMSEAYFCRFFKEITARSPVDYINQYRVRKAAELLKTTNGKMMEIALDVGFNNLSYFISVFKSRFGCTPAAYRKREQAG